MELNIIYSASIDFVRHRHHHRHRLQTLRLIYWSKRAYINRTESGSDRVKGEYLIKYIHRANGFEMPEKNDKLKRWRWWWQWRTKSIETLYLTLKLTTNLLLMFISFAFIGFIVFRSKIHVIGNLCKLF